LTHTIVASFTSAIGKPSELQKYEKDASVAALHRGKFDPSKCRVVACTLNIALWVVNQIRITTAMTVTYGEFASFAP
jgi:hypothetical protein